MEGDWSAWDSGKPKDWSKQAAKPEFQDLRPAQTIIAPAFNA